MEHFVSHNLLAFLALSSVCWGADPAPKSVPRPQPSHLVPVYPYPSESHVSYIKQCHKLLLVQETEAVEMFQPYKWGTATMIIRPSFDPEECIALKEETNPRGYTLIYTRADRNIYYATAEDEDGGPKKPVEFKITKLTCSLDPERSRRIYSLWNKMLMGVRYPEEGPRAGCPDDGITIEFRYAWEGMYGETCSPSQGPTKDFVDLGKAMIQCCKSPKREFDKNLSVLDDACKRLESSLDIGGQGDENRKPPAVFTKGVRPKS